MAKLIQHLFNLKFCNAHKLCAVFYTFLHSRAYIVEPFIGCRGSKLLHKDNIKLEDTWEGLLFFFPPIVKTSRSSTNTATQMWTTLNSCSDSYLFLSAVSRVVFFAVRSGAPRWRKRRLRQGATSVLSRRPSAKGLGLEEAEESIIKLLKTVFKNYTFKK